MPLSDVPPRLFSESMRDLDLVVSVAHRGGVDPEATASTIEMPAALVEQADSREPVGSGQAMDFGNQTPEQFP